MCLVPTDILPRLLSHLGLVALLRCLTVTRTWHHVGQNIVNEVWPLNIYSAAMFTIIHGIITVGTHANIKLVRTWIFDSDASWWRSHLYRVCDGQTLCSDGNYDSDAFPSWCLAGILQRAENPLQVVLPSFFEIYRPRLVNKVCCRGSFGKWQVDTVRQGCDKLKISLWHDGHLMTVLFEDLD